jgi:hypothetical protein
MYREDESAGRAGLYLPGGSLGRAIHDRALAGGAQLFVTTAAARQGGWARRASAVTDAAGNLRSARGALDNILQTGYVDFYKINLADVSEADRRLAADTAFNEVFGLIQAMGGSVPREYRP